jgi:hypothetical protein
MIDQVDAELADWAKRAGGVDEVQLGPPSDPASGPAVGLYLLDIRDRPQAAGSGLPPIQVSLRYLVTSWASDPVAAHNVLGKLLFAALADPAMEVDLAPLEAATWAALNCAPRPSFWLQVPLRQARPTTPVPVVRSPMLVQLSPFSTLFGQVVGPADVPVTGARVALPDLEVVQETDRSGRFQFDMVPMEADGLELVVSARGQQMKVQANSPTSESSPLVVHFDSLEDANA